MRRASVLVRAPRASDEPAWRRHWAAYLAFYYAAIDPAATNLTLRRILDSASSMLGRIAEQDGAVVGFAICVVHDGSWSVKPTCYLEDLFVEPIARGAGVGRALLDDLVALGAERGWASLYWHTRANNARARRLYERYVPADEFVRYRLPIRGM